MQLWDVINFGYNESYLSVCHNYTARDQTSWDFTVCEGARGWPASHVISPALIYFFFGDFLLAWVLPGAFEIFEVLVVLLFDDFIVFTTTDIDLETLTGSYLGDWLFCGTLGILVIWQIAYLFDAPPLLPATFRYYVPRSYRYGGSLPPWFLEGEALIAAADARRETGTHASHDRYRRTPAALLRNAAYTSIWWRQLFFWFFYGVLHIGVDWVYPETSCVLTIPNSCTNTGLMLVTGLDLVLLGLIYWIMWRTPKASQKYVLHGYSWRRLAGYFFVVWLFILSVQIQNWQHLVPLYLGVAGAFTQVWAVAIVWFLALFLGNYLPKEWSRWRRERKAHWLAFKRTWRYSFWCVGLPLSRSRSHVSRLTETAAL